MNNLSEKMQERLDKWRQNAIPVPSSAKINVKHSGKNDYGDVNSLEEWEEEVKRSQRRK